MASLKDIPGLSKRLRLQLERDGWTVDDLATADPVHLTGYKGIGLALAARIIDRAQVATNRKLLQESLEADQSAAGNANQDNDQPTVSVRVQRIRDAHARGELI